MIGAGVVFEFDNEVGVAVIADMLLEFFVFWVESDV